MVLNTYGQWPWTAAAALAPMWTAVAARRRWLSVDGRWVAGLALPILLGHQTEEWVKPGGFLPFANQEVLGSDRPDWPLTERLAFHVNVTAGWGTAVLGLLLWRRTPAIAAGVIGMEVGNVAMHTGMALRHRRYNPGVATAAVLMGSHAAASVRWLKRSGRVTGPGLATAAVIGAAFSSLPMFMKTRMRRAADSPARR